MWKRNLLLASVLAVITFLLVGWADKHLPYSETKNNVLDVMTIPGGFLAGIFYPQGVHTGYGTSQFVYFVLVGNFLFYLVVWYLLLWVGSQALRGRREWFSK